MQTIQTSRAGSVIMTSILVLLTIVRNCSVYIIQAYISLRSQTKIHMAQSSTTTLIDLPIEIHLLFLSYLDYPTRLILSYTNTFFRSFVTVEKPTTPEQKYRIYLLQRPGLGKCLSLYRVLRLSWHEIVFKD